MKKIFALFLMLLYCSSLASCSFVRNNNTDTEEPLENRTTITIDEWKKAGKYDNFSVLASFSSGAEIIKFSNDCVTSENYSMGGSKKASESYAKIDGITYMIEKTDAGYVASKIVDADTDPFSAGNLANILSLGYALNWDTIYYNLIYVEECKIYRATIPQGLGQDEAVEIEVECENGNVKKVRLYLLGREIDKPLSFSVTFYNIGTTVTELPEYTFANE